MSTNIIHVLIIFRKIISITQTDHDLLVLQISPSNTAHGFFGCCGMYVNTEVKFDHKCRKHKEENETAVICRESIRTDIKFCKLCGFKADHPRDIFVHWLCVHSQIPIRICSDCGDGFYAECALVFHQIIEHGGVRETEERIDWL